MLGSTAEQELLLLEGSAGSNAQAGGAVAVEIPAGPGVLLLSTMGLASTLLGMKDETNKCAEST